jgi:type IV pilus biogenesis protein CpaD/CtpE
VSLQISDPSPFSSGPFSWVDGVLSPTAPSPTHAPAARPARKNLDSLNGDSPAAEAGGVGDEAMSTKQRNRLRAFREKKHSASECHGVVVTVQVSSCHGVSSDVQCLAIRDVIRDAISAGIAGYCVRPGGA